MTNEISMQAQTTTFDFDLTPKYTLNEKLQRYFRKTFHDVGRERAKFIRKLTKCGTRVHEVKLPYELRKVEFYFPEIAIETKLNGYELTISSEISLRDLQKVFSFLRNPNWNKKVFLVSTSERRFGKSLDTPQQVMCYLDLPLTVSDIQKPTFNFDANTKLQIVLEEVKQNP